MNISRLSLIYFYVGSDLIKFAFESDGLADLDRGNAPKVLIGLNSSVPQHHARTAARDLLRPTT
jgi:hypothetical protein